MALRMCPNITVSYLSSLFGMCRREHDRIILHKEIPHAVSKILLPCRLKMGLPGIDHQAHMAVIHAGTFHSPIQVDGAGNNGAVNGLAAGIDIHPVIFHGILRLIELLQDECLFADTEGNGEAQRPAEDIRTGGMHLVGLDAAHRRSAYTGKIFFGLGHEVLVNKGFEGIDHEIPVTIPQGLFHRVGTVFHPLT